VRYSSLV
jgi:hypothetical protein